LKKKKIEKKKTAALKGKRNKRKEEKDLLVSFLNLFLFLFFTLF